MDGAEVGGTVVTGADVTGGLGAEEPLPMVVVMGPCSMYTPEMNQSSAAGVLTIRSTPTWKSAELVEVDALMFCATLVSGAEPVEAHSPTVLAEN